MFVDYVATSAHIYDNEGSARSNTQHDKFNGQNLYGPRTNTDHNSELFGDYAMTEHTQTIHSFAMPCCFPNGR